ncbi:nucleotidyltransferase family protein [Patescibacteria group bacterium]|nr:nucleotidyltransferase family protein [Patescibacteria group bacterium]MBU4511829.1 nucleotidyltransferase family protein [Patescibacteria group bacterium]MCG2692737.1 nucleotidyltransferase family protein [Candidatus Parcubacteria bacterium]
MTLFINKKKFEVFLEVAGSLNKIGITPILYGSLGLNRVIGEFGKANDIDVLVPDNFVNKDWNKLMKAMETLGFALKDEHEHEFERDGELVAFAADQDLREMAKIDPDELRASKVGEAKFKEVSAKQYLTLYQVMLRDNYRQEKRGGADREKIELIKKYLKTFKKMV